MEFKLKNLDGCTKKKSSVLIKGNSNERRGEEFRVCKITEVEKERNVVCCLSIQVLVKTLEHNGWLLVLRLWLHK